MAALIFSALAAAWAAVMLTGAGQRAYAYGFFFTEFFAGVVTLVALSLTVMLGLLATDRLVLLIRHRVLLQSAHRATGVLGVVGLLFHVLTKVATGRAASTDAVVPFVGGRGLYVGLGTVAALLMVSVLWTGIIRARFAGVGPKWLWRALHSLAYLAWPFALVHGLYAGRPAKSWVMLSYLACLLLVVLALLVRLSVTVGRRSREQHQAAAMNQALLARPAEEGQGRSLLAGLVRRGDAKRAAQAARERREAEWARTTAELSVPAGGRRRDPERFTVPVVPEPGTLREPVRPGRRERDEERAARRTSRSRTAEAAPAASRSARYRDEEPEVETTRSRRRRAEEPASGRSRRGRVEETQPAADERTGSRSPGSSRRRRRAEDEVDAGARYPAPRRRVDQPEEPWTSPRRWEAAEPISAGPVSAGPVSGTPISGTPISAEPRSGGGRHSVEEDVPEEPDYWRPPARYAPEEPPVPVDDTPTLVDLASRRARKASGEGRSGRRKRANANADAVDGAYWAGLRGEAK
ncbi:hypothetical protein [Micromonospora sp. WMMD812]|uniref:hypothetical protein n=1 Tax=Micromonospora sp. WMMD812 TaxID=3015152 RepID=UPI00248B6F64|nr:hypothetical protein [Micromonospora sp. WMMD812]WBB67030.1 hypothetical protein O7603_28585 [Micromonospora sp. WMMD812]